MMMIRKTSCVFLIFFSLMERYGAMIHHALSYIETVDIFSQTQYYALRDLFYSTGGPYWRWNNGSQLTHWNFSGYHNPCKENWQGLICNCSTNQSTVIIDHTIKIVFPATSNNNSNCSIIAITLPHFNMSGHLPLSIGNISALQLLSVSNNHIHGPIPYTLGKLSSLSAIDFGRNFFTGSIPIEIFGMRHLKYLIFESNKLAGRLSQQLSTLPAILVLSLSSNKFVGQIPKEFGNFTCLQGMNLSFNLLSGSLPPQLGSLSTLQSLSLSGNAFTGGLPSSFGMLSNLTLLSLRDNGLHGSIPAEIGAIKHLRVLDLGQNYFGGQIPPSICNLTSLAILLLDSNTLTGTIPRDIGNLNRSLGAINLGYNYLEGTLPVGLCDLRSLFELLLGNNMLQGSLPQCIVSMRSLVVLELYTNMFTGPLPSDLGNLDQLYYLDFGTNYFTGPIPASIGSIGSPLSKLPLNYLFLNYNLLTGGIPEALMRLNRLYEFYLNDNFLVGPIPVHVGNLSILNIFCAHNNMLSGQLPGSFSTMRALVELFLQGNKFTGPFAQVFNSSVQRHLADVDISSNNLSGPLPAEVFNLRSLNTFAAVSNCITGSLPVDVCGARRLGYLALDGMNTATNCRKLIFPEVKRITTYTRVHDFQGGLPSCIFNMTALNTLHLSGVGLNYAFPSDLVISPILSDLSLSNNIITGIIPDSIQLKVWNNLDLSYNRITGTLRSDFPVYPSTSALNLVVNRLSGDIPLSMMYSVNISILEGNLFYCDANRYPLPVNDPDYDNYACGSNSFDTSLIVWSVFCSIYLICCIALLLALRYLNPLKTTYNVFLTSIWECSTNLDLWMSVFYRNGEELIKDCPNICKMGQFLANYRSTVLGLTAVIALVFLPLVYLLTYVSYSLTDEYTWTITIAFISGQTTAFVLLAFLMLWMVTTIWAFNRNIMTLFPIDKNLEGMHTPLKMSSFFSSEIIKTDPIVRSHFFHNIFLVGVFVLNILLVVPMNCLYVYITIYYDTTVVDLAQLGMACFKIVWMDLALTEILRKAASYSTTIGLSLLDPQLLSGGSSRRLSSNHVDRESIPASTAEKEIKLTRRILEMGLEARSIMFHVFLVLLNNIGFPIIAALFVSTNCFKNAFIPAPAVDASYQYLICASQYELYRGVLCTDRIENTVYTSYNPPFQYSYQCSSILVVNFSTIYVYMFTLVGFVGPILKVALKLLHYRLYGETEAAVDDNSVLRSWFDFMLSPMLLPLYSNIPPQLPILFDRRRFIIRILAFTSIFLSYGVTCSPVAVILFAGIVSTTVFEQACIGRLLTLDEMKRNESNIITSKTEKSSGVGYRKILDNETEGICELIAPTVWVVCPFLSLLYAFFIFDAMGSEVGWRATVAYALIMAFTPIIIWLAIKVYQIPFIQELIHTKDEDGQPTLISKIFSWIFVEAPLPPDDALQKSSVATSRRRSTNTSVILELSKTEHQLSFAWDNKVDADRDTEVPHVANPMTVAT